MRIKIKLYSDLCAASGKGWSGSIDNDVCFDECGLPYIPAKRVKGCLRDAARFIGVDNETLNRVYGAGGSGAEEYNSACMFRLSDGFLENHKALRQAILNKGIIPEIIMDMFCDIRSSTEIENDTAKNNSLRFTRVVSRLSPFDEKPLEFFCELDYSGSDKDLEVIENSCKALRSIGYKRNRGFGAVRCELERSSENVCKIDMSCPDNYDNDEYVIDYTVLAESDIAIPQADSTGTADYVPGAAVLGLFANKLVKSPKAGDYDFNDIFYSGRVRFGNMYVCDKYGAPSFPAPFYLAKYKDSSAIKNTLSEKDKNPDKVPKPLKSGYLSKYEQVKVKTKITYHHSHEQDTLYTQECIESGQLLSGRIYAPGEYAKLIIELLSDGKFNIGRSKTAQYSSCRVLRVNCEKNDKSKILLEKNKKYAVLFRSDYVPTNSPACGQDIFISMPFENAILVNCYLLTRVLTGYNSKWNMKRPHIQAVKAGSAFVFTVDSEQQTEAVFTLGERLNEGCGWCEIIPDADKSFSFEPAPASPDSVYIDEAAAEDAKQKIDAAYSRCTAEKEIILHAVEAADLVNLKCIPNTSQLGRVSLMAKEALQAVSWQDFINRVNSIKSQSTKDNIKGLINTFNNTADDMEDGAKLRCVIQFLHILRYKTKLEDKRASGGAK